MPVSSAPLPVAPPYRLKDPGKQASSRRSPKKGKRNVEGVQADTCTQLKDLPVHGLILNQVASRIPAWLRQIL